LPFSARFRGLRGVAIDASPFIVPGFHRFAAA
jgi:hypothetical protein